MSEFPLTNISEPNHAGILPSCNQLNELQTDAPALLGRILQETGARYVQLFYEAIGDVKYKSTHYVYADQVFEPALNEYIERFVEENVLGISSNDISAEDFDKCFNGLSLAKRNLSRFEFLPIYSAINRLGVLILGYDRILPQSPVNEERQLELVVMLSREIQKQLECKEKIYSLNKSLITVQEPRLLGDIFKHQINPLLNLLTSAIICAKEGKATNEYRFYYNYNEFPKNEGHDGVYNPPHTIGVDSFGYLYDKLRKSNESELYFELDFDRYADKELLHPFFEAFQNLGFQKAIIVNLLRGTETVGFWVLIFNKGFDISDLPAGGLEAVAVQIAATVHSINTFSQLIYAKKEGEILQSLNVDLASTRDERNLLKLIRTKLFSLFQFSHHFIYKINDDQVTVSMMLMDSHSRSQFHPSFETVMRSQVYIADGIFNRVLISSEPVIFDLGKLNERGQLPLYLRINYESGIKKIAMLALRVDSRVMGIWCVAFTREQLILPRYLELIKTAAAPISIAVDNIRINESLREREAERDKLMDLSFDLTTVRNKNEFMKIIEPFLRNQFVFSNLSIFVNEDDYESRPFIYISSGGNNINDESFKLGCEKQFKGAGIYSQLFETTEVSVSALDRLIERAGESPFLKSEYDNGIRAAVTIALRNDNRQIGVLNLYLPEGNELNESQLHLFKEISYKIAKSVSNILYNEEIDRRESEKELLLLLSEDIAAVREKDQLIKVINERLKPTLKFTHISLSMKCPDGFVVSFLNDPGSKSRTHRDYRHLQRQDIRQCSDFIDYVDASPGPVIVSKNSDHGFKDLPKFLTVNFDSGIEEILIARLFDGISVFGYWVLCFSSVKTVKANQFGLLQAIANQFSTAIYNIIANMEIIERQKENELLITLSNASAGLRNYCQLMMLISTKLKNVFDFDSFYVGLLNDNGDSLKILIPEGEMGTDHHIEDSPPSTLTVELMDVLIHSDQPIIIGREKMYEVFWKMVCPDSDSKKAVVTTFMFDNQLLAVWVMFFSDEKRINPGAFRMMKGISDQLSIAVANIRINDRLASNERQKGLLLSLSTKVSSARNPVELLKVLAAELKTVLKFLSRFYCAL
jgi:GAF domain-containing protein